MEAMSFLVCQQVNKIIWLIKFSNFQRMVLVLGMAIVSQLFQWRPRLKFTDFYPKTGKT